MPALIVRAGPSAGYRVEVSRETTLGRSENDFLEHDAEIAHHHAVVRPEADGLVIEDLGSASGTFVNDRRVGTAAALGHGDVVRLGQTTLEVELEVADQPSPPPVEQPPAAPPRAFGAEPPVVPPGEREPPAGTPQPRPSGDQPAYGPLPTAPPGTPSGTVPAYRASHGATTGREDRAVTAAGVILLVVGIVTMIHGGRDLFGLVRDFRLASEFGIGGIFATLIVLEAGFVVAGVLQAVGGIRVFPRSRAGRTLGIIGSTAVIVLWLAAVIFVLSQGGRFGAATWGVLAVSVIGSAVGLVLLASQGRAFPRRYRTA